MSRSSNTAGFVQLALGSGSSGSIAAGILMVFFGAVPIYVVFKQEAAYGVAGSGSYNQFMLIIGLLCILMGIGFVIYGIVQSRKEKALSQAIVDMANSSATVSPQDFLKHKQAFMKNGDYTGVYVIHNISKDLYYVGQSTRVVGRVSQHFTGHGNGDVYADYKYGDQFTINTITLNGSGFDSIDALERNTIAAYNAYNKGYNKTRGNSNY